MGTAEDHSVTIPSIELDADGLGYFRWGRIGGKVVATNDAGEWVNFSEQEFDDLLSGKVDDKHPRFSDLQEKGLVRDGLDLDAFAAKVAERNRHVRRGPHLHVLNLVRGDVRMSSVTAERVMDRALQGTSPKVTFEFQGQGADPLSNFDVLRSFVDAARTRNEQTTGKVIRYRVFSNTAAMTDEIAEWLIENDVALCTTLDGPAALHDGNRSWKRGAVHADVVRWIEHFHNRYSQLSRDPKEWHVDAMVTVVRGTLKSGSEVIDEYIQRGLPTIHFHPLEQRGFDQATWASIGYTPAEYLDFYRATLDVILERNVAGKELSDRLAAVVARKILANDDPGIVDIQSPCGAGTGEVAYEADGVVYPGEAARRVGAQGDAIFELGSIENLSIDGIAEHPTVRALAGASVLEAHPMCADCWNKPYCGINPVRNYSAQGDLFGQLQHCFECKEHSSVSARLFEVLMDESKAEMRKVVERWAEEPSPHATDARVAREAP